MITVGKVAILKKAIIRSFPNQPSHSTIRLFDYSNISFSALAGLPVNVRPRSGQPCSPREKAAICASMRPLGVHEYAFGSQSCANRLLFVGCARLRPRPWPRMAPAGVRRVAPSCLARRVVVADARRASAPGASIRDPRRGTSSAGYRLPRSACASRRLRRTASARLAPLLLRAAPRASPSSWRCVESQPLRRRSASP